ncbi:MAG: hypothetical protein K2K00_07000, partial [Muribaculaceae bacterium]|nr:hypothetical protein [Muribaculaceae bacterium]
DVDRISLRYREKVIMAVAAVIVRRFADGQPPLTVRDIIVGYHLPSRLVGDAVDSLVKSGLVSRVVLDEKQESYGYQPAMEVDKITVSEIRDRLEASGRHGFIPSFDKMFPGVVEIYDKMTTCLNQFAGSVKLVDIPVETLVEVKGKLTLRQPDNQEKDNIQSSKTTEA